MRIKILLVFLFGVSLCLMDHGTLMNFAAGMFLLVSALVLIVVAKLFVGVLDEPSQDFWKSK